MRRALLVGINDYPTNPLKGCINDALRMQEVFETHEDGNPNFDCKMLLSNKTAVTRPKLREGIEKLFNHDKGTALLYFSGHGATRVAGTYLVTQDQQPKDVGISLMEVVAMANNSNADEVIIILDCCYAGGAGNNIDLSERKVILREGVSILAAAADNQYSYEKNGSGVFTSIIYNAMLGGAADIQGKINLSGIYSYADNLLNAWKQRPVFKSHVSHMISLRNCKEKIPNTVLKELKEYFPEDKTGFTLTPNHTESKSLAIVMQHLRLYYKNGLLTLKNTDTLDAESKANGFCILTPLGTYYKKLAQEKRL